SGRYKSKVRFATVDDLIFAHSGFFTAELDAVPFGPDAYRFVRLLRASLADVPSGGAFEVGRYRDRQRGWRNCRGSVARPAHCQTAMRARSAQSTRSQTYASADRLAAIGLTAIKGGRIQALLPEVSAKATSWCFRDSAPKQQNTTRSIEPASASAASTVRSA